MDRAVRRSATRNRKPGLPERRDGMARKGARAESRAKKESARRRHRFVPQHGVLQRQGNAIHAVTFDVGGTLIECWPSVGHIYAEVAAQDGLHVQPAALNRRFKAAWQAFEGFRHTRADWLQLVQRTFDGLAPPSVIQILFPRLYDRFAQPDAWHVYEDVTPLLTALRARGLKLGIISNWDDRLRPLLKALKLEAYFDSIMVSCEVGVCKPAREVFRAACAELGSAPEHILHIGDNREADWQGARDAGLQALHLRRGRGRRSGSELGKLLELDKL